MNSGGAGGTREERGACEEQGARRAFARGLLLIELLDGCEEACAGSGVALGAVNDAEVPEGCESRRAAECEEAELDGAAGCYAGAEGARDVGEGAALAGRLTDALQGDEDEGEATEELGVGRAQDYAWREGEEDVWLAQNRSFFSSASCF